MTDDQTLGLIVKVAALAAIGAFYPQIKKWMHKIGYRDWRDKDKK